MDPLRIFILFVFWFFGTIFGSFANVVIWRLPRNESLSRPGSHCPHCNTPIKPYDNIPVLSFLILRAQCRSCKAPISARYPLVELSSGILWLGAALIANNFAQALLLSALFYLLLILTMIDLDTHRLPNKLVATAGALGIAGIALSYIPGVAQWGAAYFSSFTSTLAFVPFSGSAHPLLCALLGALISAGPAFIVAYLYQLIKKKTGFGMGDIKLLLVVGIFLGPLGGLVLPLASIIALFAIGMTKFGNQNVSLLTKFAFGPFIALATVVILIGGPAFWNWYLGLLI